MLKQEAPSSQERNPEDIEKLRKDYLILMDQEERWYQDFRRTKKPESMAHLNNTRDKIMAAAQKLGIVDVVNLNWQMLGGRREREEEIEERREEELRQLGGRRFEDEEHS